MARSVQNADLYVAVALGGVIGACARRGLDLLVVATPDSWPMATFVINITGAFIIGVVMMIGEKVFPDPEASGLARRFRPFLITGVLGGYTTFSTFMVEAHGLVLRDKAPTALMYVLASLIVGVLAVWAGRGLMRAAFLAVRRPVPAVDKEPELDREEGVEDQG